MISGDKVLNPWLVSRFDPESGDKVLYKGMKPGSVKVFGVMDKAKVQAEAPVVKKSVKVVEKAKAPAIEKDSAGCCEG